MTLTEATREAARIKRACLGAIIWLIEVNGAFEVRSNKNRGPLFRAAKARSVVYEVVGTNAHRLTFHSF